MTRRLGGNLKAGTLVGGLKNRELNYLKSQEHQNPRAPDLGPGFTGETQEVGPVVTQKSRVRWIDTQLSPGKPI
jgi:hypothetical protein